jgi:hypothetical protein
VPVANVIVSVSWVVPVTSVPITSPFGPMRWKLWKLAQSSTWTGYRYFDFGTSNTLDGGLNGPLYEFKAGFAGGGVPYDLYEFALPS